MHRLEEFLFLMDTWSFTVGPFNYEVCGRYGLVTGCGCCCWRFFSRSAWFSIWYFRRKEVVFRPIETTNYSIRGFLVFPDPIMTFERNPRSFLQGELPIFPGKYHQNCGFSMAMLVSGSVRLIEEDESERSENACWMDKYQQTQEIWAILGMVPNISVSSLVRKGKILSRRDSGLAFFKKAGRSG